MSFILVCDWTCLEPWILQCFSHSPNDAGCLFVGANVATFNYSCNTCLCQRIWFMVMDYLPRKEGRVLPRAERCGVSNYGSLSQRARGVRRAWEWAETRSDALQSLPSETDVIWMRLMLSESSLSVGGFCVVACRSGRCGAVASEGKILTVFTRSYVCFVSLGDDRNVWSVS